MNQIIENVSICGIRTVVPDNQIDNLDCVSESLASHKLNKQIEITGIKKRCVLKEDQTALDLATAAAEKLLDDLKWEKDSIQLLVYVTQTPEIEMPSSALLIQKLLGIPSQCLAFDVNLGCSGYVAGLQIAASMIRKPGDRALLLTADGITKRQHKADELLFGNAGSATALEYGDGGVIKFNQQSDGSRYEAIHRLKGESTVMDGNAVFAFAINDVVDGIKDALKYFNEDIEDIDYFAFHQGQKLIIETIADMCGIDKDKILYSMEKYGNTSSSSIPLSICNEIDRFQQKERVKVLLSGFGVGLAWGNVVVEINTNAVDLIEKSNLHYSW